MDHDRSTQAVEEMCETSTVVVGSVRRSGARWPIMMALLVAVGFGVGSLLADNPDDIQDRAPSVTAGEAGQRTAPGPDPRTGEPSGGGDRMAAEASTSPALLAAERYVANPGATTLRDLLASIGGLDALVLGEVVGAFDMLRFDPLDPDRLLATVRSSYGDVENQDTNEFWFVGSDGLVRGLWSPGVVHDFAHFNSDGTITMWVPDEPRTGFVPRSAVLLGNDGSVISSSGPMYASRFAAVDGKVFALTGTSDYYSNETAYQDLIADDGGRRIVLESGSPYGWIDTPGRGLLVAYPVAAETGIAVWDTTTFERLDDHPLAGRSYRRVAISGDGTVAVGVTADGRLARIDASTGEQIDVFGSIDVVGIDQPIMLDHDGTIAITVERSGSVTVWWVGSDEPVASVAGDAAQPRWVDERQAALSSSVVASDASRVALRFAARPLTPVRWTVVDTSTSGWIERACDIAGRRLAPPERRALGLPQTPVACS